MHYVTQPYAFIVWYIKDLPFTLLKTFTHINLALEAMLAIRLHAKMLFVPLFQDKSIVGRAISIVFRLTRVFGGLFALLAVNVALAPLFLIWLLLPLSPLFSWLFIGAWPVVMLIYALLVFEKPTKFAYQDIDPEAYHYALTRDAKKYLRIVHRNPENIFEVFIQSTEGATFFTKAGISADSFLKAVHTIPQSALAISTIALKNGYEVAHKAKARYITPTALVVGLLQENSPYGQVSGMVHVPDGYFYTAYRWLSELAERNRRPSVVDDDYFNGQISGVNRGWTGMPTPVLDTNSTDLTAQALGNRLRPIIGREAVINQLKQILSRAEHDNVLIIGESGSGKMSLAKRIAQDIVSGTVPKSMFSKRMVVLNVASLIAGEGGQSGIEGKMKAIAEEIVQSGNIILCVEDMHALLGATFTGGVSLFSVLRPYLSDTKFQIIGTTTKDAYARFIEPDPSFTELFEVVELEEVNNSEAVHIVQIEAQKFENKHKVFITLPAINAAVSLASRYVHDKVLPGKALDLLDEACVYTESLVPTRTVTADAIEKIIEQKTHIPVHNADKKEKDTLLNLEAKIHERMIGQEEAVAAVANAMRRARTGVVSSKRPIASFLFVGPTGVGKTELAKSLAATYFGSEDAFIRFDMSEFQEQMSVYRLIGAPAVTGQNQPGQLTEAVRRKPFCLLLFDEIEKAHPAILDLFLQMLDDGRLTDSLGHTVTFKDTIIISTSNAATTEVTQRMNAGVSFADMQKLLVPLLSTSFRIEFLNRFDDIILFKPLSPQQMMAITKLMLNQLQENLIQKGFMIEFTDDLVASLAARGFDPQLGARPLRRLIQNEVESMIAKMMLADQIKKGEKFILSANHISPHSFA